MSAFSVPDLLFVAGHFESLSPLLKGTKAFSPRSGPLRLEDGLLEQSLTSKPVEDGGLTSERDSSETVEEVSHASLPQEEHSLGGDSPPVGKVGSQTRPVKDKPKPSSWLDSPSVRTALVFLASDSRVLACASGQTVALALLKREKETPSEVKQREKVLTIQQVDSDFGSVTAVEWLVLSSVEIPWLCVGTTLGYVCIYSVNSEAGGLGATCVLTQRFHRDQVVGLKFRMRLAGIGASDQMQEVSIVYPHALVAVQLSDLQTALLKVTALESVESEQLLNNKSEAKKVEVSQIRRRKGQVQSEESKQHLPVSEDTIPAQDHDRMEHKATYLPFLKWRFGKTSTIIDAAIMGVRPGKFLGGYVEEPAYAIAVAGSGPFLAFYDAPIVEESESVLSRASVVATKVGTAVYSSASSVLSYGRTFQPNKIGSKLYELGSKQSVLLGSDTEADRKETGASARAAFDTLVKSSEKPLQNFQKAVTENWGAAATSLNTAASTIATVGPANLGKQIAANISARSSSLGSLTGLGLREKLRTSLGVKASRSLESVQSIDSTAPSNEHVQSESQSESAKEEESRAEQERLERLQGVPASLVGSLTDAPRKATKIWMAPRGSLGAVADNLGRVLLIDGLGGVVLRVWKGYRDAQCAWVQSEKGGLVVWYLVIYAPRRGLLEIWPVPYGPRLASTDCAYGCRLLLSAHPDWVEGRGVQEHQGSTVYLLHPDCTLFALRI